MKPDVPVSSPISPRLRRREPRSHGRREGTPRGRLGFRRTHPLQHRLPHRPLGKGAFRRVSPGLRRISAFGTDEAKCRQMRITPYHLCPTTEVLVALECGTSPAPLASSATVPTVVCRWKASTTRKLPAPPSGPVAGRSLLSCRNLRCYGNITVGRVSAFSLGSPACLSPRGRSVGDCRASSPRTILSAIPWLRLIAEERNYGKVCGKPAVALAMDLNRPGRESSSRPSVAIRKALSSRHGLSPASPWPVGRDAEGRRCCLDGSSVRPPSRTAMVAIGHFA